MREPSGRDATLALLVALGLLFGVGGLVSVDAPMWVPALAGQLGFAAAAFGVVARRLDGRSSLFLRRISWRPLLGTIVGAIALHVLLRAGAPGLAWLFERMNPGFTPELLEFERRVEGELREHPVPMFLTITALPALCEEVLFRGILLAGYARAVRPGPALWLTAGLFGLIHQLPLRVVMTGILGLYFGYVVLRTGSLWCGVAAHAMNNVLAVALGEPGGADYALAMPAGVMLAIVVWRMRRGSQASSPGRRGA